MTAQKQTRRLITLIFAGRNRMVMIRRELPRTEYAGLGRSLCRTERKEGSPFRGPCAVTGSAVQSCILRALLRCLAEPLLLLDFDTDCPDETEQLASERRYDLVLILPACIHRPVAFV